MYSFQKSVQAEVNRTETTDLEHVHELLHRDVSLHLESVPQRELVVIVLQREQNISLSCWDKRIQPNLSNFRLPKAFKLAVLSANDAPLPLPSLEGHENAINIC